MQTIRETSLPAELHNRGKVRDNYIGRNGILIQVTTDRISAYDRVLNQQIPGKGQCLNESSVYSFENTRDIIPNHFVAQPHGNVLVVKQTLPVPVEAVVRGYISGSAWRAYNEKGRRVFFDTTLPEGLRKNQNLMEVLGHPLFTPTTKARTGHDTDLTPEEYKKLTGENSSKVRNIALSLFLRANEMARRNGYAEADTKYEFGVLDPDDQMNPVEELLLRGELLLIDEANNHDSSRFFRLDTYREKFEREEDLEWIDKEFVRKYLLEECGFKGDGPVPDLPPEIIEGAQRRLIESVRALTGRDFVPTEPSEEGMVEALRTGGYI